MNGALAPKLRAVGPRFFRIMSMRLWRSFKPKIREIKLHIFSGEIKIINIIIFALLTLGS